MGKMTNGILGPFTGKVGPVCGAVIRGKGVIKTLPRKSTKPKKQASLIQNNRFTIGNNVVKLIGAEYINIGYHACSGRMSPFNAAVAYHTENAIAGVYPDFKIDYSKIKASKDNGGLKQEYTASVLVLDQTTLQWSWDSSAYNKELLDIRNMDQVYTLIINEQKGIALTNNSTRRGQNKCIFAFPPLFANDTLHCYLFFVSADRKVSNTQYLGTPKRQ